MEIEALIRLTRAQCPYTPNLLSWSHEKQCSSLWIPGVWLIFILMKNLPGIPPFNFWKPSPDKPAMTRAQRDEVREAFKNALSWVFPAFSSCIAVDNLISGLFLTAGCCRMMKKEIICYGMRPIRYGSRLHRTYKYRLTSHESCIIDLECCEDWQNDPCPPSF
jgi:hypothetical protein